VIIYQLIVLEVSELVSPSRICRFCMTTYEQIKTKFSEDDVKLRTAEIHTQHLHAVKENPGNANVYGVRGACAFSDLEHFDVTQAFPPDVMHDFLEGVIPLVLKHFDADHIVSLRDVNEMIKSFAYGQNDKSCKPVQLTAAMLAGKAVMIGKASEKWCLFRLCSLMFGSLVPTDDKYWQLYLLARDIGDIILAPACTRSSIVYLKILVYDFMLYFAELAPERMTPKVHMLLHYPRLMLLYGSMVKVRKCQLMISTGNCIFWLEISEISY